MRSGALPAGWLTVATIAAVVTVNAAGIWGIAAARRTVREESLRLFRAQTESRARSVESALGATRTDLAFLAGSPAVARLGEADTPAKAGEQEGSRRGAEASLLVFLQGHPEVRHLTVMAGKDEALVEVGRRGGVPVLWRTRDASGGSPTETERTEPEDAAGVRRIRAVFAHARPGGAFALRLVAEIDAGALLSRVGEPPAGLACRLRDASGHSLLPTRTPAVEPSGRGSATELVSAEAAFRAEGWSAPSPWSLTCAQPTGLDATLEPVAARGRRALALNLAVMSLAVLLGFLAVHQARSRERVEAQAREEQRVRDLERQLFHAERLGSIGRLAAGLAHEINNPLEGMANYLAVAREHLAAGDLQGAREDLDLVRQGLDRTSGIVRQVLAQANPASAVQGPLELSAVVRQTVEFVRSRPEFRGIDLQMQLPDDPLLVQGSAVMLGQVLLNLLRNACEAQPHGGEVRVRALRESEARAVKVEIADRGPGISAADRRRIFEPFYSTKSSTGLGLSVCDAIVRQHQGRLEVGDREGGGAVFALSLPDPAPPAPPA